MEGFIEPLISFEHVSVGPVEEPKLDNVSFCVMPGERVALIGPGAAGKTLLLHLILGLGRPDAGQVRICGHPPGTREAALRLGAVLETTDFPAGLKVIETIELVRAHYTDPSPVDELVSLCGFDDLLQSRISSLNPVEKRWLSVLLSMAGDPEALVLDEPTTGMDAGWRRLLWDRLSEFSDKGGAVLISSDVMHEVESFASRVLLLHHGRIWADATVEEMIRDNMHRIESPLSSIEGAAYERSSGVQTQERTSTRLIERPALEEIVLAMIDDGQR